MTTKEKAINKKIFESKRLFQNKYLIAAYDPRDRLISSFCNHYELAKFLHTSLKNAKWYCYLAKAYGRKTFSFKREICYLILVEYIEDEDE